METIEERINRLRRELERRRIEEYLKDATIDGGVYDEEGNENQENKELQELEKELQELEKEKQTSTGVKKEIELSEAAVKLAKEFQKAGKKSKTSIARDFLEKYTIKGKPNYSFKALRNRVYKQLEKEGGK